MSLKIEGTSCARCKAYLFSEDDIVYCPECGAPHHRECYSALGHCALEELHGTELEYSRKKVAEAREKIQEKAEKKQSESESQAQYTVCQMCGERYAVNEKCCPKCSAPNFSKVSGFGSFDFLGGVPADYKLDENVTAEDAKRFVAANTHRYIPKFAILTAKKKISWNWMAFFFPCEWMLSRKMFKNGIIVGILSIMATLLTIPLSLELENISVAEKATYFDSLMRMVEALPQMSKASVIFQTLGVSISLIIKTVSALYGDYIYKNHTVSAIKKIKSESEDIALDYRKQGGVNIFWFFIASMALQYLPVILITII